VVDAVAPATSQSVGQQTPAASAQQQAILDGEHERLFKEFVVNHSSPLAVCCETTMAY